MANKYLLVLAEIAIIGMICVSLQDLHLVLSMSGISEFPRRFHSVRMLILTPYGEVSPLALLAITTIP